MIWIILISICLLSSCQPTPQENHYTEVVIDKPSQTINNPPAMNMPDPHAGMDISDPHAGLDMTNMLMPSKNAPSTNIMFNWITPKGWVEKPGEGLRMASFYLKSDKTALDCSIVSLGPSAGGLEANLKRWMGQIDLQSNPQELTNLINTAPMIKTKGGQEAKIYDFSALQPKGKLSDKSMIAVMIPFEEATLFVKITGSIETIKQNKNSFIELVKSIKPQTSNEEKHLLDPHAGLDMASMGGMLANTNSNPSENTLTWSTPSEWKEEQTSHMRLATFRVKKDPSSIDCSIIILGGSAGGVEANLNRWIGQIGLKTSDANLQNLIKSASSVKTKNGLEAKIYDFTTIQESNNPSSKSMLATMIPMDNSIIFVKMTGHFEAIKANKNNFIKLVESISHK